jgi:hypothetical protein
MVLNLCYKIHGFIGGGPNPRAKRHSPSPKNSLIGQKLIVKRMPALGGEAVILFERYEQKDKSESADPAFSRGNAHVKKKLADLVRIKL